MLSTLIYSEPHGTMPSCTADNAQILWPVEDRLIALIVPTGALSLDSIITDPSNEDHVRIALAKVAASLAKSSLLPENVRKVLLDYSGGTKVKSEAVITALKGIPDLVTYVRSVTSGKFPKQISGALDSLAEEGEFKGNDNLKKAILATLFMAISCKFTIPVNRKFHAKPF